MVGPDGDDFTLRFDQASGFLQIIDDVTGEVVNQKLLQETSEVRITGTDQDDSLTVDLANFVLPGGITFEGGLGSDELNIINGAFESAAHSASAFGAGDLDLFDGTDTQNISYTAVEAVKDQSAATDRTFANATGLSQSIRLTDDATPADNVFTVDSAGTAGFSAISFSSPSSSVSLVAGDSGDTITVDDSASGASALIEVQGGLGADTLLGSDSANTWSISGTDTGDVNDIAFTGIENLAGGSAADTFYIGTAGSVTGEVSGGAGTDTVAGADTTSTWTIDGADAGDVNGLTFSDIENLQGGSAADNFNISSSGSVSGQISGGSGADTLAAADTANVWEITGTDAGTLNSIAFVDIENLTGGAGDDIFKFLGGSISGTIEGGAGQNSFDYSGSAVAATVDLEAETATGAEHFANVGRVVGSDGDDTLIGSNQSNLWNIDGLNTGDVGGFAFEEVENLQGGTADDSFAVTLDGQVTGVVSGGLGLDNLTGADGANIWNVEGEDSGRLNDINFEDIEDLIGGLGQDAFLFAVGGVLSGSFAGRGGNDRARGADKNNSWRVTGDNAGDLDGIGFTGIEELEGGILEDTFAINVGATLTGSISGGAGSDTIFGPVENSTWLITGADAGNVNGLRFSGLENLVGGTDVDDTFFLEAGGSLTGGLDGGAGPFDSLFISGEYTDVVYATTGPDSGWFDLDGAILEFAGLEPTTLDVSGMNTFTQIVGGRW